MNNDKYEGRYFLEDKPGHSVYRGWFTSVEKAKQDAEKIKLQWWRIVAYNHETNCWDILLEKGDPIS